MITTPQDEQAREVLDEWREDGLAELTLPSGRHVRVRPGSLMELAVAGLLPAPLMAVVLGGESMAHDDVDSSRGLDLLRSTQELAAGAVEAVQGRSGVWVPVSVDVPTFLGLPSADRAEITRVAIGEQFAEVAASLTTFRDEPTGDGAGDDGGAVRTAPVVAPRPNRAARRAGPRPGARG
jgi:hypothetical protein